MREKITFSLLNSNNLEYESNQWKIKITSYRDQTVFIRVDVPHDIGHGWWNLRIATCQIKPDDGTLVENEPVATINKLYFCV